MNSLNRKQYKKDIKEFRKICPLAQIQSKWVYFTNEYGQEVLMFVHGSTVKRDNSHTNKYNAFEYGPFYFKIELYGNPSITNDNPNGVLINTWCDTHENANKRSKWKIIEPKEVLKYYHKVFEKGEKLHEWWFSTALKQHKKEF